MTEATPGLELFLSSEKAVAGANKFREAVESAAKAVEGLGAITDRLKGVLGVAGESAKGTASHIAAEADAAAKTKRAIEGLSAAESSSATARRAANGEIVATTAHMARAGTAAASFGGSLRALALGQTTSALMGLGQAGAVVGASLTSVANVSKAMPGGLGLLVGLAGSAAAAFFAFGRSADDTSAKIRAFLDDARDAEAAARRFDDIRLSILSGQAKAGEQFVQAMREQLVQLDQLQLRGKTTIPADDLLGAMQQAAPALIADLREVQTQIAELGQDGKAVPNELEAKFALLSGTLRDRFGVEIARVRKELGLMEEISGRFSGTKVFGATVGFTVPTTEAIKILRQQFDRLSADAQASAKALADAAEASRSMAAGVLPRAPEAAPKDRARSLGQSYDANAVREFIDAQRQALDLAKLDNEQKREQAMLAGLVAAAAREGRGVRLEELATAAQLTAEMRQQAAANVEKQRADTTREVIDRLRRENALLEVQGAQREALRAQQEVELLLSQKKAAATAEEQQQIDALLATRRQLLELDEQRKAFVRTQREDNRDLTKAARDAEQAALQYGEALSSALGDVVINGQKARDVIGALGRDMAMMALKATTSPFFAQLFQAGGKALANWLTPGASQEEGWFSNMTGGVIPALGGQVVDDFGMLTRGGRRYSFAEGGSTTPEAIFPLQRDSRGRLGVAAGDGGGGSVIHMSFPNVRNAADARAARATLGQRMRRLGIETRGRRGLRPGGA